MLEPLDYYAAGLVDGEGTITLGIATSKSNNKNFRLPIVSMSSTSIELLEFMKARYGGTICSHKVYQDHHKQSWSWKAVYSDAVKFCEVIGPILLEPEKRHRANLIATEYSLVTKRNGKYSEAELAAKYEFQERFFK